MVFAPTETVGTMRELLLEYGAEEGKKGKAKVAHLPGRREPRTPPPRSLLW